ncbi:MAG: mechanosensitive ion channel family protein [Spirochaetaceae bacterium]|jgi:small-conductance mechanosensitive channel|nr:mechanosensitive ion channel family protein [Spirochaetaceae bacterium]
MNWWKRLTAIILGDASKFNLTTRLCIAAAFALGQIILIWLTVFFFRWVRKKITALVKKHVPSLTIKKLRILETSQILEGCYLVIRVLKYVLVFIQLFLTIPLMFSLFAPTQNLAATLFAYILTPLKQILLDFINYIPNLIYIIMFFVISKYIIRSLRFFSTRIEKGKLVIPGFYPDWAQPTFNIFRFLIYAFTVALIYPYLPGSDSRIFQAVSVFVGLIFSFGSSSAINNLVAGIVLTYMRPFKLGDRIQIQNVTGFVVEKSPVIIRLRTHKNEYVTFPNSMVLTSSIINYHTFTEEQDLIIYAEITFGYSTPWETIHRLLIDAARKTSHILHEPAPFVLQTALDDFYAHYQINAYVREVNLIPAIYSELFANIQCCFRDAGLDMTAAHFRINLPPAVQKFPVQPGQTGG